MPFTVTNSNLKAPITKENLTTAIKNAMAAAGFTTLFDEIIGSSSRPNSVIYEITLSPTSKAYLEIEITPDRQVRQRLHADWDPVNNIGTDSGNFGTSVTFNNSVEITFRGFQKSSEGRLVGIRQSNTIQFLGYIRPENIPSWWNESSSRYAFIPATTNFISWNSAGNSPYGNTTYTSSLGRAQMASANPITSKRDLVTGMLLYSNSNQGAAGRTSNDFAMVAAAGLGIYDLIQVTPEVEEYTIIHPAAGGLALRTT